MPPNKTADPSAEGTAELARAEIDFIAPTGLTVPIITADMDNLTAALAYAEAGWFLVPTDPAVDGKSPGSVVGNGWPAKSSRDPKQIAAWFAGTDYGIALHCGRSGAVSLDVDNYNNAPDEVVAAAETTGCPHQSSRTDQPGRGHYVFANTTGRPIGNGLGKLATAPKWGEIRGSNGVIIAAPSAHRDGGRYRWERTGPVPPLPDYVAEALPESSTSESTASDAEVRAFIEEHQAAERPEILAGFVKALAANIEKASRHDSAVSVTAGAMKEARAGFYSAQVAIDTLRPIFINSVTIGENKRTPHAAAAEWDGIVAWAVGQANGADLEEVRARVAEKMPARDAATAEAAPRFFDRDGLLAQNLAEAVMDAVPIGWGVIDQQFYTYADGVWSPNTGSIEAVITRLLGNRYRNSHARNALDMIRHSPRITRITCEPVSRYINTLNGMYDWQTAELHPHAPEHGSTVQIPVRYDPGAECPHLLEFIAQVLPEDCYTPTEDSPGFIWELLAYALYNGNPFHIAILLFGNGRNGKGTLIRFVKRLLGDHNVSTVGLHELAENRFRTATLFGKLANLAGDLDSRWLTNTAVFKAITGGDAIQGERKFGAAFDFTPWALPVYSANKAFGAADSSEGWVARWVVIPFPMSFLGREDRGLDARLQSDAELAGALRRAVQALPALMARGRLPEPKSLEAAKRRFVADSDAIRGWLAECCELDAESFTARSALYAAYRIHTESTGAKGLSARELYARLEQVDGLRPVKRNGGERGFLGIRLTAEGHGGQEGQVFPPPPAPHGKESAKPAPPAPNRLCACGGRMLSGLSLERGYCESCRIAQTAGNP